MACRGLYVFRTPSFAQMTYMFFIRAHSHKRRSCMVAADGGPAAVWIGFDVPAGAAGVGKPLNITVGLFNKTATRIGEAMFMRFNASGGPSWTADVLQGAVNPGNVVPAGNQHQHGVQRGVTATTSRGAMNVSSKEAALAVFGALTGFPTPT